jgi:hypothetical protein
MRSIAGTVPGAKPLISLATADLSTALLLEIQQCVARVVFKPAHPARCPVCNTRAVHRCSTIAVSSNRPAAARKSWPAVTDVNTRVKSDPYKRFMPLSIRIGMLLAVRRET